jgi:hypothetical protein
MPVHRQKKDSTPNASGSTQDQPVPPLPDQQTFQQYLRELARAAIRVVLEGVMRQELDALIGVGWGECSPKRKGYRNGFYSRDLVTSSGRIEEINVPRDRAGQFHTQVFERYRRYEPHIAEGLTHMFVSGTSTRHPWGKWLKPCWESLPVPVRSAASTRASPTNLRRGGSDGCKSIGVCSTSMAYISAFVMETKPIPPSF